MTADGWASCLDRLEQHLRRQRAAIESSGQDVEAFVPDAGLGPLPLHLRDRAQQLSEENDALETLLRCMRDEVADAIQRADAAVPELSRATFLDTRV